MDKRINIYAYTQVNLGDDLFIKILCDRYPKDKFYIVCNKNTAVALKKISNLFVIPGVPFIDGILFKLKVNLSINNIIQRGLSFYCDAIVNIGGSIFNESECWRYNAKQFKKRIIKNKPYYIIGSNFGAYKDINYYEEYNSIFKTVDDVCFRDKHSYKLFSDLSNVRHAPDVVFSYSPKKINYQKKQVIISVMSLGKRKDLKKYEDSYYSAIIKIARYFSDRGFSVYLMGFCEKEGDHSTIQELIKGLTDIEKENIKPYYYVGNIGEALMYIQESQYVIATRFHSMILGWVFQKPVYPIVYNDKSLNVINDMGFNGKYTTIQNINEIKVEEVYEYITKCKPLNVKKQKDSVNDQFKMLDKFLLQDNEPANN